MKKKMTKAAEDKGGRHANMVPSRERRSDAPPLSESYVGGMHRMGGHKKMTKKK